MARPMLRDDFPNAAFYNTKGQNNGKVPKVGDRAKYWDYDFTFTEDHLTPEQCEPLRQSYDVLADEALEILRRIQKEEAEKDPDTDDKVVVERQEEGEKDEAISEEGVEKMKAEIQDPVPMTSPVDEQHALKTSPSSAQTCPFSGTEKEERVKSQPSAPAGKPTPSNSSNKDLLSLLLTHHASHPTLQKFYNESTAIPSWVSWPQIQRGQEVFFRHAAPMFVGLTFTSLLGGLGAWRVVETLARTGGFNTKVARKRLYETTQFVLEVVGGEGDGVLGGLESMMPPGEVSKYQKDMEMRTKEMKSEQKQTLGEEENLLPQSETNTYGHKNSTEDETGDQGGPAWRSAIRVRLLHASVRHRILTLAKSHPSYYSTSESGIPINDLHSIGTISTFAPVLLFGALPRQGLHPTPQECEDFIALWRLVAYFIGCPDSHTFTRTKSNGEQEEYELTFFKDPYTAKTMMESLLMSEIKPNPTSRILSHNIIECLVSAPPAYPSRSFLVANARWCNGDTICDALGLEKPGFLWKVLISGQCLFFIGNGAVKRWILSGEEGSPKERNRLKLARKILWNVTVNEKTGLAGKRSGFEFRYVPELGLVTGREDRNVEDGEGKKVRNRARERRAVLVLLGAVTVLAGLGWGVAVGVRGLFRVVVAVGGQIVQ